VLSPVLAFLMAIAVEILIDLLLEANAPASLAFIGAGAIVWSQFPKLWVACSSHAGDAIISRSYD